MGGSDVLGPAISALFTLQDEQCQYTQNALMCFDAQAQGIDRYHLYSLGDAMNIANPEKDGAAIEGGSEGIPIFDEFDALYNKLNGPLYVGLPLAQARFNPNRSRIEQYFENVGFYRDIDSPRGEVHLLSYGVYACSSDCRFPVPESSVVVPSPAILQQPFQAQVVRLGGPDVFGMPLTEPFTATDGNLEQVYENAVFYASADDPANVHLRNVPLLLGMQPATLISQLYGEEQGMVFYPLEGDKGHHVPVALDRFIASHGGMEISGKPIGEVEQDKDGQYNQCFENYCLTFSNSSDADTTIHLQPLGRAYMLAFKIQSTPGLASQIDPTTVSMVVHAATPRIPANKPQQFELIVVRSADQQPVPNVTPNLILALPSGQELSYAFPPTDGQGRTTLTIAPLQPEPANGKVISFKACLDNPNGDPVCVSESYLIWNYQ